MNHFKPSTTFIIILFVFFFIAIPVIAQENNNAQIPIAIPDIKLFGIDNPNSDQKIKIDTFTSAIYTEINKIPYFRVLERQQANKIYDEIELRLNTEINTADPFKFNIEQARAILITGLGLIYNKIVITARLVDLQTGRVLLAETIYTDEEFVTNSFSSLTASIREKAAELGMQVTYEDIERAIKAKSWKDAKRRADIYLRNAPGDTRVQNLYETIALNRAKELYSEARRLVKLNLFKDARIAIDEAIALSPKSEYYAYRDTIGQAELDYQYNQKAELQRREEDLRTGKVKQGFVKQLANYFNSITTAETRLGVAYAPVLSLTNTLSVNINTGDWGFDLGWINPYFPANGNAMTVWSWYAGIYGGYERVNEGSYGTLFSAYISPLLTQSIKLGSLVLHVGLDGGGFIAYGPYAQDHRQYGYTIGGMAELGIRFIDRLGIFTAVKADWREYLTDSSLSGPVLRFVVGGTL